MESQGWSFGGVNDSQGLQADDEGEKDDHEILRKKVPTPYKRFVLVLVLTSPIEGFKDDNIHKNFKSEAHNKIVKLCT